MVKVIVTGDLCPINRISDLVNSNNIKEVYNDFATVLDNSDINITNLECPLYNGIDTIKKSGPNLSVDESFVKLLNEGKFNLVTLANNHIMDSGSKGLFSTMQICENSEISFVGAGSNLEDARKPYIKVINGLKIGILNFTENEFSTTNDENPGANPLNPISNYYDIKKTKKEVDFLMIIIHGGHEYYELPSPRMQETYRFFIDAGADAVVGHHTHCCSGYEIYNNKPIFYSLGNFLFDWPNKRNSVWNFGFALELNIEKNNFEFKLHPYEQNNEIAGIHLLNQIQLEKFEIKIKELNTIIGDKLLLNNYYNKFINDSKKDYLCMLQPYSSKILKALYHKNLLPSIYSKDKKRLLLNLIRCEAHRDRLIGILK